MTRRVGVLGASGIGAGAMLGAGVFVVWGPATALAGPFLLIAVALASMVAILNALSTAQLAAHHPVAGGAYTFGRREVHEMAGFVAGIGFVVGKTASVAAIALAIGSYAAPDHAALVATAAIATAWGLNVRSITRTATVATVIAIGVVIALTVFLAAAWTQDEAVTAIGPHEATPWSVLGAAALVFFAFAGYARIATLGEEVRDPSRTIPRAILVALATVLVIYAAVAMVLLAVLGSDLLAASTSPVADAVEGTAIPRGVVVVVAAVAAFGSLVALMAGVGRTAMAMARESDLPRVLARQSSAGVPWLAEAVSAVVAIALVWMGSLSLAIAASSFAVLTYYAIANLAAFRARRAGHVTGFSVPLTLSATGLALCVLLALAVPWQVMVATASALLVAVALRAVASRTGMRSR